MHYQCSRLLKFIGIVDVPAKPIEVIAARFILELDLPVSLIAIVSRLISSEPKHNRRSAFLPDYEVRALAYIVASLKLLFGLNGSSEILLSKMGERLNLGNSGSNYFVFHDWCQKLYVLNEARMQSLPHSLWVDKLPSKVDAKELGAYLVDNALSWRGRFVMNRQKRYKTKVKDVINALSKPFMTLQPVITDDGLDPKKPSASFLPTNLSAFVDMYGKSALNASSRKWLKRNFSSASIDFITNRTDDEFEEVRDELLRSLQEDGDPTWLTPWTRYTLEADKATSARGSHHMTLLLECFSDIYRVSRTILLKQIEVIEGIIFGNKPMGKRAIRKRYLAMRKMYR